MVIGKHERRKESGQLKSAVTVWRTHHGNLDAHAAQSSHPISPVAFDGGAALKLQAKFGEEFNGGLNVCNDDADVVHALDCHDVSLVLATPTATSASALEMHIFISGSWV